MNFRDYLTQMAQEYLTAKKNPFGGQPIQQLFSKDLPTHLTNTLHLRETYKVVGSVGKGNWANIPWLAFLHKAETDTTRKGTYVVYLFSEDLQTLYLTLMEGVDIYYTDAVSSAAQAALTAQVNKIRSLVNNLSKENNLKILNTTEAISLGTAPYAKKYALGTVGFIKYQTANLPSEHTLLNDLKGVLSIYEKYLAEKQTLPVTPTIHEDTQDYTPPDPQTAITYIADYIASKGFTYTREEISNFYLSLKAKPFLILAGISGTGKSKLVELFAEALGANRDNNQFTLIPVRPDWNDSTDLLGYRDIEKNFQPGPLTRVIEAATANPDRPYFLCLDEMNLSRVEYYFSDYLSLIESRKLVNGSILTANLINESHLTTAQDKDRFGQLMIPDNLYIIGTVNMDETTHPFSKKVLDRANTLEFSTVILDKLPAIPVAPMTPLTLDNQFLKAEFLNLQDCLPQHQEIVQDTVNKLIEINNILLKANLHIGYRVRDEVSFYLIHSQQTGLLTPDQAFDNQLLQKILPRIQGSSHSIKKNLVELFQVCTGQDFTNEDGDLGELLGNQLTNSDPKPYPKSAAKIALMIGRFEEDGFTSFWS
ncbi:MAG: MrcB family domain-containing protein [Thermincolia bacterium]